jgi:hypothetical protein
MALGSLVAVYFAREAGGRGSRSIFPSCSPRPRPAQAIWRDLSQMEATDQLDAHRRHST